MVFVVASLYQATVAHLSAWQLVLVGTTVEATILLFEIPTGVVADAYSRRLSVVIGFAIMGLAFLVEGSYPHFGPILFAQVLWGVGYTFTSGSTQAWLSDEIGEGRANQAFLHANQYDLTGALVGILAAIPLGNIAVSLPIVAGGGGVLLLAAGLAWYMPEHGFKPTPRADRNTLQHMLAILQNGWAAARYRPALRAVLGVGLIYGLYSEGWDRLWVKFLVDHFSLPHLFGMNEVPFFGLLRAGGMVLSIIATRLIERRIDVSHASSIARSMLLGTSLLSGSILLFVFSPALGVSVLAIWLVSVCRNVMSPLYDAWVNQRLDPATRATVISMSGQVDALGQITSGPLAAAASLWSIQAAISSAALLLLPAFPLITRADRLHEKERAAAAAKTVLEE